jgi:hypothetical protein
MSEHRGSTPRAWRRQAAAAAVGAVAFLVLGQLMSLAGSGCTIMCNPVIAVPYGAIMGLLFVGEPRRGRGEKPN